MRNYGKENDVMWGDWTGQLGLEPHPSMFIEHLVQIFSEVKRVLKPSGSCWIVMGDTYYGGGGGAGYSPENKGITAKMFRNDKEREGQCGIDYGFRKKFRSNWLQPKQKMLIPERFAIEMQENGWLLRNVVIWHKINPMPSSVLDRLSNAYEDVFFFTKNGKYYFNLDAIRRQYPAQTLSRAQRKYVTNNKVYDHNFTAEKHQDWAKKVNGGVILGGNPADVWSLTSESFKGQHFATYPQKLVKRILKAVAPKHALVLDPFCGSGTTLIVAHKMGLDWVGIDINTRYCAMANRRLASHGKIRLDKFMEAV